VTSIGYVAFLAGPPFVGLLGNHVGTLHALLAVAGVATAGLLLSRVIATAPGTPEAAGAGSRAEVGESR
jgi:hypothetical protein